MGIRRYYILLILVLLGVGVASSQVRRMKDIYVEFPVNDIVLDSTFRDNEAHLAEIMRFLDKIERDTTHTIVRLVFCGSVSPEGSSQLNRRLANGRLKALEKYVRDRIQLPDSIIRYNDGYIPWDVIRDRVEDMDYDRKEEVLDILKQRREYVDYHRNTHIDKRIVQLMEFDNGVVWKQLHDVFHEMRSAHALFITDKELPRFTVEEDDYRLIAKIDTVHPHLLPMTVAARDYGFRHLHVSTNLPFWGLLVSNATVEVDFSRHWSFALPVYYSALNYFADDVKFRTFALQPELRYWFRGCESSWYVGAHAGLAYYNVAWGELFRYQDHNMDTPAVGGGLSIGYRLPFSKSKRWCFDVSVGAGIYGMHYDRFINVPNGFLVDSHEMVYMGIDQAAISLSYMFDLAKRKK